jgi:hypothetical protein
VVDDREHRLPPHVELGGERLSRVDEGSALSPDPAGLAESCGLYFFPTTVVSVVGEPPGRSTKLTPRSVRKRKPTRMLPPGAPPSWSSTGSIWRYW